MEFYKLTCHIHFAVLQNTLLSGLIFILFVWEEDKIPYLDSLINVPQQLSLNQTEAVSQEPNLGLSHVQIPTVFKGCMESGSPKWCLGLCVQHPPFIFSLNIG